jgi:uncharacterized protein (DUF1015 family)
MLPGSMADIAPLTPLRFDLSKLSTGLGPVVAPPYDVINDAERAALCARHPNNVVRLELPEGEGDAKYEGAAKLLAEWQRTGVLQRDNEPAFYRYDQRFVPPGETRTVTRRGFFALVRAVPFEDRVVLPHERTLSGPKEDRWKLLQATKTQLSPGFLLYRDARSLLDQPLKSGREIAAFSTPDGVHHSLSKVTARDAIHAICAGLAQSTLLIADGHHRYETSVRYATEAGAAGNGKAEHRYFMALLVNGDDPQLRVFPTHRHVHGLASVDFGELLARAEATFSVLRLPKDVDAAGALEALRLAGAGGASFAVLAPDGSGAVLTLRKDVDLASHPTLGREAPALVRTDVTILHAAVLEHLLGISKEAQAAKTNIWYPQDAAGAFAELRKGKGQLLFLMNPTPVEHVRDVAEAGLVMPQKSTFFYPKVPTGLLFHTLIPERFVPIVL